MRSGATVCWYLLKADSGIRWPPAITLHAVERLGALRVLGRDFHHDAILVQRVVDRRDLALAERVVQRLRHVRHPDAELPRRIAIDVERDLLAGDELVLEAGQLRAARRSAAFTFGAHARSSAVSSASSV